MKIIDATWEIRNLGKKTVEFEVETALDITHLSENILNEWEYAVLKSSAAIAIDKQFLTKLGFSFNETLISLRRSLNNIEDLALFNKMGNRIELEQVKETSQLDDLISRVGTDMFHTDRIALEPRFGIEMSNHRYKNWVQDMFLKANTEIYVMKKKTDSIGFFMTTKTDNKKVDILLGGLFTEYQNRGLGYSLIIKPLQKYNSEQYDTVETKVSSNNLEVLKIYLAMGYTIEKMEYIYTRFGN